MSEGDKHLPTAVESEIHGFDSSKLKHAECHEKTCLPSADVISQEKTLQNIEGFDKSKLKHAETAEKVVLPDGQELHEMYSTDEFWEKDEFFKFWGRKVKEKTIQNIEGFDKHQLKHTETEVKNPLPDKKTIEEEKRLSSSS